jgi:hypothetical protein
MLTSKVMTVQEVAEYLKVSTNFVRKHATGDNKPVLVGMKFGSKNGKGLWRFLEADVQAFMEQARQS